MKSWTESLKKSSKYEVKPAPIDIAGMKAGQIMLVPSAMMVDEFIRNLPFGSKIDYRELRAELAEQHGAEVCCPITTGYHLRTVAEAAFEAFENGQTIDQITPIWRVLDADTPTTKKLSYDPEFIFTQREAEQSSKSK